MSNLPLLIVMGLVAIVVACIVHARIDTTLPRAKFVFLSLVGTGSLPIGYVAVWAVANQRPDFSLVPFFTVGATLWVTALAYSVLFILSRKDIAPSH